MESTHLASRPLTVLGKSILELPADTIYTIADQLRLRDLLVLTRTCKSVHHILHKRLSREVKRARAEQPEEFFKYLLFIVSEKPDWYACEHCVTLHPVNYKDIPGMWSFTRASYCGQEDRPTSYNFLEPRHIQLAIKLSRWPSRTTEQEQYLQQLLRPQRDDTLHMRVTSRVIQGRFLRKIECSWVPYNGWLELLRRAQTASISHDCCSWIFRQEPGIRAAAQHAALGAGGTFHECPNCAAESQFSLSEDGTWSAVTYENLGIEGASDIFLWTPKLKPFQNYNKQNLLQYPSESPRLLWGDERPASLKRFADSDLPVAYSWQK